MDCTPKVGHKTNNIMNHQRHNFEFRLNLVSQALNGCPLLTLEERYNTSSRDIRRWVRKYELYGEEGLHNCLGNRFTLDEKEKIVKDVLSNQNNLSLPVLALYHNVSYTTLRNWLKRVKKHGLIGLRMPEESKPKPKIKELPIMARPKKKELVTELEKLQSENYRLRAENELLKKVKALVEKREAQERMIGRKSSKN